MISLETSDPKREDLRTNEERKSQSDCEPAAALSTRTIVGKTPARAQRFEPQFRLPEPARARALPSAVRPDRPTEEARSQLKAYSKNTV